ncbi:MAG: LLM class flavin-dependent oxidoreductase [Candidatus Heimdallarchaeota archaeon]|nr:MAG: LLM class flavin-dependent oxidoreductase [Candidatus Heimdallarchaeota archaeon]
MKYGVVFPRGDPLSAVSLAQEAENAKWDGFFMWEPIWGVDVWVTLSAIAMRTENIKLGTMVTPVSRCRPWKLVSETATLDQISNGRVILSVALGALDTGFKEFGEETDRRIRAKLLDEGLDIITGLWQGPPFSYVGKYYKIREANFFKRHPPPIPKQIPRIPIWVVGAWPRKKSMERVLRYDGILPTKIKDDGSFIPISPEDLFEIKTFIQENRSLTTPFDIVIEGTTPGNDQEKSLSITEPFAEAGATWWIEAMWTSDKLQVVRKRIQQGPPK